MLIVGSASALACNGSAPTPPKSESKEPAVRAWVKGMDPAQQVVEFSSRLPASLMLLQAKGLDMAGGEFSLGVDADREREFSFSVLFEHLDELSGRFTLDAVGDSQAVLGEEGVQERSSAGWIEVKLDGPRMTGSLEATIGARVISATFDGKMTLGCMVLASADSQGASPLDDSTVGRTMDNDSAFCDHWKQALALSQ